MESAIQAAIMSLMFLLMNACGSKKNTNEHFIINEDVQKIIIAFIEEKDFAGYVEFEDDVYAINTCLTATLYDIDTNHYLTLIISRYPEDPFLDMPCYSVNPKPTMYYNVCGKDLFVYNHSTDTNYPLFPLNIISEKAALIKERTYLFDDKMNDARFVTQTYKYHSDGKCVWIEKDTTFNLFQWVDRMYSKRI